jgi:hypothetical protein
VVLSIYAGKYGIIIPKRNTWNTLTFAGGRRWSSKHQENVIKQML